MNNKKIDKDKIISDIISLLEIKKKRKSLQITILKN